MSDKPILLLEDQPLISLDVEEALLDRGLTNIVTLRSQKEATAWLSAATPAFVVLDLFLDDGDSRQVLSVLRERQLPFIIYTGSEKPHDWDQDLLGGCDWVDKPTDPDAIAALVTMRLA